MRSKSPQCALLPTISIFNRERAVVMFRLKQICSVTRVDLSHEWNRASKMPAGKVETNALEITFMFLNAQPEIKRYDNQQRESNVENFHTPILSRIDSAPHVRCASSAPPGLNLRCNCPASPASPASRFPVSRIPHLSYNVAL